MEKTHSPPDINYVEDTANDKIDDGHNVPIDHVTPTDETPEEYKLTFGKMMAILLTRRHTQSFQLGYFSDTLVVTMVSTLLQVINRDIGPSKSYAWIITSITVVGAAVAPVVGRFGDIYGRRNFLLAGNALALVGTAVAATAKTVNTAIVGGSFIGVATSMRQLAWACLGEIVPKRDRGLAFGFLQQSLGAAAAFGPVIAYGFINNGSWRPVYWLPFALDATSFILVFFYYHPMNQYIHEVGKTTWGQFRETDFIGTFLYMSGVVVFLLGISFGGQLFPWRSAGTIVPIVLGFVTLVLCGIYEAYAKQKYAIFPREVISNFRGFTVLQIATFLLGMLYYSIAVLWPAQVQALYATSNLNIGWYAAAGGLSSIIFCPIFGILQKKLPHSRWQLLVYTGCMTICCGCLATSTPASHVSSTVLVALSFAFVSAVSIFATAMVQLNVKHEHIGVASGLTVTMRTLGGAVATTIYLTILNNKLVSNLPKYVATPLAEDGVALSLIPDVIVALTSGDATSPVLAQLSPKALLDAVTGLKGAYANAFRLVYLVSIAFGVIGTFTVAFAADVDHQMTRKVDVTLAEGAHIRVQTDTGEGHIIGRESHEEKGVRV
ncbi:hypothetical protein A1O3_03228 [Capronia epimyces CBS 606.96]|uniref:Major facilitator superfamily (MFS) profile domain-containing protein n=1 Tax=Capronia epimyces CBS 606.96 TaxID=1182542 RepID=W9Z6M1_9EURO|nr:uncharacterized protein A1O3_03228 [Capronia epimyces CBS 606.96]EXJ90159.1 hypothetical protein A1O3_03228 [Capronia epimyces CBS 606.96]